MGRLGDPLPHVILNHKTIFFLVIDLYPHETSASKRPQPEFIEITEDEILGAIKSSDNHTTMDVDSVASEGRK